MNVLYSAGDFAQYLVIAYLGTVLASLVLIFSRSVMANSFNPMDCNPPDSTVHGIL